ncbi:NADPH dependend quinone reductase [Skermanella stibiiresistens SB22]|uniref:NADPH dependend quinone reductase n=1 Tax=Skermanella stibiiresistens SB22 TaxID=1385369 RepID=W9H3H8_9PROT|nr:3-keto-5-aminohexanoate cleavage protein [Skermanella stibiiresistens]EWY38323.1 NADPH dependend quinone reductase [Skermanella stibiiresistens SB22]
MRPPRRKVFITCAITGNLTTPDQTPHLPITPGQIAASALDAAKAGAAIVHLHVREPATGRPSMELPLYREAVDRIRAADPDVIINLTTGPGGRFVPSPDEPRVAAPGTTLIAPELRVAHIAALRPEICTLDLNTMNSGREVVINTPDTVRRMASVVSEAGVRPEIELFDSGDIALMADLIKDGTLAAPPLCSFVMGVRYGFQPSMETILYARGLLPPDSHFTAVGIGRASFPTVALSYLAGGHVRVGLEDAVYLSRGVLAPSNAALVEKARRIVEDLGGEIASPAEARDIIGLIPNANHPSSDFARPTSPWRNRP